MKKYFIVSLLALVVLACHNQNAPEKSNVLELALPPAPIQNKGKTMAFKAPVVKADEESAEFTAVEAPMPNSDQSRSLQLEMPDKKIIKEGDISFETADVIKTRKQVLTSLREMGGYAESDSETINGDENRKEYVLSIRVPAANFDAFLDNVSGVATKIDSKNIRIKDVTTEYIDTKTRLNNKLELEKRYLSLLSRAGKMRDLLDIEEKLTQISSEIESTQSQLNYMSKQVDYSSLTITFYTTQPTQVNAGNGFGYKFMMALGNGLDSLQSLFFGLVGFWPFILVGAVIWLVVKRWRRNRRVQANA